MVPQLYKVLTRDEGFLAVMGRPRAGDWLEDEARGLRSLGVDTVASLLELSEEVALDLGLERQAIESLGMRFVSFPIADRGVPANPGTSAPSLAGSLRRFKAVAASLSTVVRALGGPALRPPRSWSLRGVHRTRCFR
jgi:hypothetical protein